LAKRGRRPKTTSLLSLVQQLNALDAARQALLAQIRAATNALSGGAPEAAVTVSVAGVPARRRGGRRKGFKMSAEARAKISAAAKKRWAAKKKADKG